MNDFLKLAEDLGWSYNVSDTPNERGEVCVELEKYSPQGQDFIATIWFQDENEHNFIKALREYWQDFDPDEEACKWIGEDGHGKNGAPYSIRDILDDMEDCKGMLRKLYVAFHNKAYPDNKIGNYSRGLTLDDNEYNMTDDERRAVIRHSLINRQCSYIRIQPPRPLRLRLPSYGNRRNGGQIHGASSQ